MRVIFETAPVQARGRRLLRNQEVRGTAQFRAILYDIDEEPARNPDGRQLVHNFPVADFLKPLPAGEPIRIPPPDGWVGPAVAVIPRSLLDSLPPTATLSLEWALEAGGGRK